MIPAALFLVAALADPAPAAAAQPDPPAPAAVSSPFVPIEAEGRPPEATAPEAQPTPSVPIEAEARPPGSPACDTAQIPHLAAALAGNRLIQADRMLVALRPACAADRVFAALDAQWLLRTGRTEAAFALYSALLEQEPANPEYAGGAGRAAMRLGRDAEAFALLIRATASPGAGWRAWNAIGILHDRRREWAASARAYDRALQLSPDEAQIWNNRGYSLLLQGLAAEARPALDRALALDSNDARIRRNRELALALAGTFDDRRRPGETRQEWARRLNNMGYGAWLAGNPVAARSLLARAIEASETRFERAERNLARVEGRE